MAYSLTESLCRDRFSVVETRRFTHELTGPLPGREYHVRVSARDPFGKRGDGHGDRHGPAVTPATGWRGSQGIARGSTASGSAISGASVSAGETATPTALRLSTIIRR
jgi:hypothetical protein